MSNHLLCKRILSVMLVLALVFSIFPMAVYAEENTATVSFSIDGTSYKVDMKFEDDLLFCRADQWAEAAECLWAFNSDQQRLYFYYNGPTILASYDDQEYITEGNNTWVPFFDAAKQTGVYFSEVSGFTVCGYRSKPLAVFYKDMDRMFGISKYRTSEMIIKLGGVWALISSASRAYAILSSLSIEGFLDAVSGKMDQDMYDAVLLDLLKTDETLLGAITGIGETLDRPGKVISTLQKSLDEGGAFVKLLEEMGFSESEIREIVWDLSQEVYGSKLLNDLADLYDFNQKTHFLDLLGLLDDMTLSLEADAHTILAMETVLANSESTQISSATKKAIGLRTENTSIKAEAYLESLGDILWDNAIEKMGDVVKETTDVKTLRKLGAKAFVWVFDKSLSMTETTNAIMYSDVYSQIQLELTSYYYRHRDDPDSDNALMMHSVALLYLRSCLAAWRMFEYDESLSQPISNATSMLTAEITNLMQYTEDELLQNGTKEETVQAINDLVILKCDTMSQRIYTSIEHGIFLAALKEAGVENLVWDVADGNNDGVNELYVECNSGGWGKSLLFYDVATDYRWSFTETGVAGSTSWVNFSGENGYVWQRSYSTIGTQTQSYIAWHANGWESLAGYGRFLEQYGTDGSDDVYSGEYQWYSDEITYEDFIRHESNAIAFAQMDCPNLLNMEWDGNLSQIQASMDTYFEEYEGLMAILDKDWDKDGIVEHSYLLQGAAKRVLQNMNVENAHGDEKHLNYSDQSMTIVSLEEISGKTMISIMCTSHYSFTDGALQIFDAKKLDNESSTKEERYKINVFLSNFSEQWFNEYDPITYKTTTTEFTIEKVKPAQLISFAFFWYNLNSWKSVEITEDFMAALSFEQVNEKTNRYFGVTLSRDDFTQSGYEVRGNKIVQPYGVGESYPNFTVANEIVDNGNGTYLVSFKIYSLKDAMSGGNRVSEKEWYYLTEAEASDSFDLEYYVSGYATVRKYQQNNVDSYQLVSYCLDWQSDN